MNPVISWDPNRLEEYNPSTLFHHLLQKYLANEQSELEEQIRMSLPRLCSSGDVEQMTAALCLLGLVLLHHQGCTDETETIYHQIQSEFLDKATVGNILQHLFYFHYHVLNGTPIEIEQPVHLLLQIKVTSPEATQLIGWCYEKIACYLYRFTSHRLWPVWKIPVKEWCERSPTVSRASSLALFANTGITSDSSTTDYADTLHVPILLWKHLSKNQISTQEAESLLAKLNPLLTPVTTEDQILLLLIKSILYQRIYFRESPILIEEIRYRAIRYGDPFWIQQVETMSLITLPFAQTDQKQIIEQSLLRFTFFQSFQGYLYSGTPIIPKQYRRKKVKELLALLLLQPHYRMSKELLLEKLFGEEALQSHNYLHVLLSRTRELMPKPDKSSWIRIQNGFVSLQEEFISEVDVQTYRKLTSVGHQLWPVDPEAATELYIKAVQIFQTPIAPEFEYEDWIREERQELLQHQQKVLSRLRIYAIKHQQSEQALLFGEQLLQLDPWNLELVEKLCSEYHKLGISASARTMCKHYQHLLCEEGEVVPSFISKYCSL